MAHSTWSYFILAITPDGWITKVTLGTLITKLFCQVIIQNTNGKRSESYGLLDTECDGKEKTAINTSICYSFAFEKTQFEVNSLMETNVIF